MIPVVTCNTSQTLHFSQVFPYHLPINGVGEISLADGKEDVLYSYYYIISNYRNTEHHKKIIDSFANRVIAKDSFATNTKSIWVSFYKETHETNVKSVEEWPKIIRNYDTDLMFRYNYYKPGFVNKYEYKKGKIVSTKSSNSDERRRFKIQLIQDTLMTQ